MRRRGGRPWRGCEIPWDENTLPLGEKTGGKKNKADLLRCVPWMGNGTKTGAARKRDRMQARRSWNQFKWYHPAPPFSTSPPTPPPFFHLPLFQPRSLSLPPLLSLSLLGLFHRFVEHRRRGSKYSMVAKEHRFALIGDFTGLLHIRVLFFCINYIFKKTSGVATLTAKVGRWHFSLS